MTTEWDRKHGRFRVNIRLRQGQYEWLTCYAKELCLSRGSVIRMLIEQEQESVDYVGLGTTHADQQTSR
jgi:hypothetical protein